LDSIGIPIPFQGIGMEFELKFHKSVELEMNWN
jgi:hypothetical protein